MYGDADDHTLNVMIPNILHQPDNLIFNFCYVIAAYAFLMRAKERPALL